jgi:uncharacterized membrane protein
MEIVFFILLVLAGLVGGGIWLIATVVRSRIQLKSLLAQMEQVQQQIEALRDKLESRVGTPTDPARPLSSAVESANVPPVPVLKPQTTVVEPVLTSKFIPTDSTPPPALEEPAALSSGLAQSAATEAAMTVEERPMAAGAGESQPPPIVPPSVEAPSPLNWEQFIGGKLITWIAGLALFLGIAFLVKFSFDRNIITPEVRVAVGYLTGIGLMVAGVTIKRRAYFVLAHTFCATGVVILYAVSFAAHAAYKFIGPNTTFGLMVLITITAFFLAVRLEAMVVAVLGMLGGFLTPPLLSTGVDRPLGLFGYIAILVVGLMAVAFKQRWEFLVFLGAAGTVFMQLGWMMKFFAVSKIVTATAIFLSFDLLFLVAYGWRQRRQLSNVWLSASALLVPAVSLGVSFYFLTFNELGQQPGILFTYVLLVDLCWLTLVWWHYPWPHLHVLGGTIGFLFLALWAGGYLVSDNLNWFLGAVMVFAILHSAFPIVLQRRRPELQVHWVSQVFPLVALLVTLVPFFKLTTISWLVWPCVLLIDLAAIAIAVITWSLFSVIGVLVLTGMVTACWLLQIEPSGISLPELLMVIGGFAVFFFAASFWAGRRLVVPGAAGSPETSEAPAGLSAPAWNWHGQLTADQMTQIPALSAILPFLLLILAVTKLRLANPSPVFGLALLLILLLLGLAVISRVELLLPVSLACVLALEHAWHGQLFNPEAPLAPLVWYTIFYALFSSYPFVMRSRLRDSPVPWAVAALSGPLHFYLIYRAISLGYPNPYLGLVPAVMSLPVLGGLAFLAQRLPDIQNSRLSILAWFGGCALFFITLIFPIQFDRQWITIGWALEGAALIWLFHRLPHPGLPLTGVALLVVAFVRLALNPAVLEYHPRSAVPIWNWYLYTYGIVTICLLVGARLLASPRNRIGGVNAQPIIYSLGAVLAFLLMNIEIADYFSTGTSLTFQFSGNFGRDMTYSIAWAIFALVLLVIGIRQRLRSPRYASLALIGVTLLKLFFHDLNQLNQLYRIGALIGVALVLILASFLYQRFLAGSGEKKEKSEGLASVS